MQKEENKTALPAEAAGKSLMLFVALDAGTKEGLELIRQEVNGNSRLAIFFPRGMEEAFMRLMEQTEAKLVVV